MEAGVGAAVVVVVEVDIMLKASLTPELYALYGELKTLPLDTRAELTFAKRLATENGWPLAYADRVLEEYLRFLLLTQAADFPISPSDPVDQAWRLHMLYSRSYWDVLCAKVLKKPLHHEPVDGNGQNQERFFSQYTRTLALYEALFGEAAPRDIWPPAEERFAAKVRFQRTDMLHPHTQQVFSPWKKGILAGLSSLPVTGLIGLLLGLAGGLHTGVIVFTGLTILIALLSSGTISSDAADRNIGGSGGDGSG